MTKKKRTEISTGLLKYCELDTLAKLIPKVSEWLEYQENNIISIGRDLTLEELDIAKRIGIKNYDIIRVYVSPIVPTPKDIVLLELGKKVGLISSNTHGICFRYGIFINEQTENKKAVLTHELIHTLQYERFGSIKSFISNYLKECIEEGYHESDLEKEACEGHLSFMFNP
jgi:hypothetical protein